MTRSRSAGPGDRDEEEPGLVVAHLPPGRPAGRRPRPVTHVDEVARAEQRARAAAGRARPPPARRRRRRGPTRRPAAPAGVTQGDRLARRAPARRGCRRRRPGPRTWSRKSAGEAPGSRSTKRAAASNSAQHGVEVAVGAAAAGPPPSAVSRHGRPRPLALHIPRAPTSTPCAVAQRRRRPRASDPVRPAPARAPASGPDAVRAGTGCSTASASSSSLGRPPPSSSSSRRSDRRSRRSRTASAPPTGEVSTSTTSAGVELLGAGDDVEGAAQQGEERAHGRLVAHREVGGGGVDRHPGAAQHPAQGGGAAAAAHDDGHPRPRHAVEQVRRAQPAGDVARPPGRRCAAGATSTCAAARRPASTRRCAAAADRRRSCGATRRRGGRSTSPPQPVRRGQRAGSGGERGPGRDEQPRVGAAEGLGGGVGVAEQHEVDARRRRRPPAAAEPRPAVSSWASSTTTSRSPAAQPVERLGVVLEQVGRRAEDPGRVEGARAPRGP